MTGLIILLIICGGVWFACYRYDDFDGAVIGGLVAGLLFILLAFPMIGFTGGLMPEYSTGMRDGYITKLSRSGVFIKTWDGQMQIGTGQMAALQEPFKYSVPDEAIREFLMDAAEKGIRVRLEYREYFVMNFREGKTSYIITSARELPDA